MQTPTEGLFATAGPTFEDLPTIVAKAGRNPLGKGARVEELSRGEITMSINMSHDKNIPTDAEAYSEMPDLVVGDHIELLYEDSPQTVMRATLSRILTDQDEGMGPEVEDYVAC